MADPMFAKPKVKAKPKAKPKAKGGLTPRENNLFNQMSSDIKKEGKASPKQTKKLVAQVAEDQYKVDELTGMGHPDAQALVKAGVSPDRVKALTAAHAADHPANAGAGITADPTNPAQYAADVLLEAGLPDTASNEKLLETQMTQEGMPGGEDNPLATTLKMPGSKGVNSAGVQEYPNLAEGAQAEAATLKGGGFSSLLDALKSGTATPQDYAAALANSNYEGLGGSSNPANVAYSQTYLADAGQPATSFSSGGASSGYDAGTGSSALNQAMGTNLFSGLNSTIPGLGTQSADNSLQSALQNVGSQATLAANTTNAPGSPDETPSQQQQTNVAPAANYQAALAALLGKNLQAGSAGKGNG